MMQRTLNEAGDKIQESLQPVTKVAAFLSLSRSKVYAMMDAGDLPFVKFGKSRRIRWSDVQRLVDENTISRS